MPYGEIEERANWVSHGIGIILASIGLIWLIQLGVTKLDSIQFTGVTLYGLSLITLFTSSTLYHKSSSAKYKSLFKIADHCAIYLLIAGTYTPLMLIGVQSTLSYFILGSIWFLAIGGIIFKTRFTGQFKKLSLGLYLTMGWLCLFVIKDIVQSFDASQLTLLITGGLFYTLGAVFYAIKRIPFNHAIWHLFVLAGAASHYFCVLLTVQQA